MSAWGVSQCGTSTNSVLMRGCGSHHSKAVMAHGSWYEMCRERWNDEPESQGLKREEFMPRVFVCVCVCILTYI